MEHVWKTIWYKFVKISHAQNRKIDYYASFYESLYLYKALDSIIFLVLLLILN